MRDYIPGGVLSDETEGKANGVMPDYIPGPAQLKGARAYEKGGGQQTEEGAREEWRLKKNIEAIPELEEKSNLMMIMLEPLFSSMGEGIPPEDVLQVFILSQVAKFIKEKDAAKQKDAPARQLTASGAGSEEMIDATDIQKISGLSQSKDAILSRAAKLMEEKEATAAQKNDAVDPAMIASVVAEQIINSIEKHQEKRDKEFLEAIRELTSLRDAPVQIDAHASELKKESPTEDATPNTGIPKTAAAKAKLPAPVEEDTNKNAGEEQPISPEKTPEQKDLVPEKKQTKRQAKKGKDLSEDKKDTAPTPGMPSHPVRAG
jgi:hypothetical protein